MALSDYIPWRRKSARESVAKSAMEFPQIRSVEARSAIGIGLAGASDTPPPTTRAKIDMIQAHPVAFWCVRKIALAVASVPWIVEDEAGNAVVGHPSVHLINNPNRDQSRSEFMQMIASSLATTGNAYISPVDSAVEQAKRIALYALRPDKITIEREEADNSRVKQYQYIAGGRATRYYRPGELCHIRQPWLSDEVEGYPVINSVWESLETYTGFQRLVRKILTNSGGVPGILVFSSKTPGGMSSEQREALQEHINRFKLNGDKFGELLMADVADGDMKFVPLAGNIAGLDQKATKMESAREICLAFGVPPNLYTAEDQKFSNYQEANRTFWVDTVVPGYLLPIAEAMSRFLGVRVAPDLSEVPALSKLNQESVQALSGVKDVLSIDEQRAKLGYGPIPMGNRVLSNPAVVALDTQLASQDARVVMTNPPELLQGILEANIAAATPVPLTKAARLKSTGLPALHDAAGRSREMNPGINLELLTTAIDELHRKLHSPRALPPT